MDDQLGRIEVKLAELEGKIDQLYTSSEKIRKYFLWTLVITLAVIVLPLLALPAVIPLFLQSLTLPAGF
jgi:hypothetical protein